MRAEKDLRSSSLRPDGERTHVHDPEALNLGICDLHHISAGHSSTRIFPVYSKHTPSFQNVCDDKHLLTLRDDLPFRNALLHYIP